MQNNSSEICRQISHTIRDLEGLSQSFEMFENYLYKTDISSLTNEYIVKVESLRRTIKSKGRDEKEVAKMCLSAYREASRILAQFKLELTARGLDQDYEDFISIIYMNDSEDEDIVYDKEETFFPDSPLFADSDYLEPYLARVEKGERIELPDMINMQIRRELKDLEEKKKKAENSLYMARYGKRRSFSEEDIDELSYNFIELETEIEMRKKVLDGSRR